MKHKLKRNIRLIAWIKVNRMFMISMAVIVPFFNEQGLDQSDIFKLQAIFSVGVMLLEVPSGYFADRFGRRLSIIAGLWVSVAAWVIYSLSYSFLSLAIGELLLAVGASFISGADSALRYDSLKALNSESTNLREDSRAQAYASLGEGVAGIIGGLLAIISLRSSILGQVAVALLALPLGHMLVEPPVKKTSSSQHPWRAVIEVTRHSLSENTGVKWMIFYGSVIGTLTYTMVWLAQPYYEQAGVAIGWFGAIWFSKHLFLALFGWKAEAIVEKLGLDRLLVLLPVIGVTAYLILALGFTIWLLPAFIAFELIRGIQMPVVRNEINKLIDSDFRATVQSVGGLTTRMSFAIFGLIVGYWTDTYGLRSTFVMSAVMYTVLCGSVVFAMHKRSILNIKRR